MVSRAPAWDSEKLGQAKCVMISPVRWGSKICATPSSPVDPMLLTTRWQASFTDSLAFPRATFVTPSNVQDWAEEHLEAQISLPRGSAVAPSGRAATPTIRAHRSKRRPGADPFLLRLCIFLLS